MTPIKLIQHKGDSKTGFGCAKCHTANAFLDLCRIGRRLFISWLEAQPEETKMTSLLRLPEADRTYVQSLIGLDHMVIGGPPNEANRVDSDNHGVPTPVSDPSTMGEPKGDS